MQFLRFGAPPASGHSQNFAENTLEAGISCYRLKKNTITPTARELSTLADIISENRPLYLIEGEEIGFGADGEPVIEVKSCKKTSRKIVVNFPWGATPAHRSKKTLREKKILEQKYAHELCKNCCKKHSDHNFDKCLDFYRSGNKFLASATYDEYGKSWDKFKKFLS